MRKTRARGARGGPLGARRERLVESPRDGGVEGGARLWPAATRGGRHEGPTAGRTPRVRGMDRRAALLGEDHVVPRGRRRTRGSRAGGGGPRRGRGPSDVLPRARVHPQRPRDPRPPRELRGPDAGAPRSRGAGRDDHPLRDLPSGGPGDGGRPLHADLAEVPGRGVPAAGYHRPLPPGGCRFAQEIHRGRRSVRGAARSGSDGGHGDPGGPGARYNRSWSTSGPRGSSRRHLRRHRPRAPTDRRPGPGAPRAEASSGLVPRKATAYDAGTQRGQRRIGTISWW